MRPQPHRRGLTLVELLVVIGIIVLLLGVSVPLARDSLKGAKVREASREINSLFLMAKARAAANGRPVAVWIERGGAGSNQAVTLFLAESPLPYTGDTFDATTFVVDAELRGPPPFSSFPAFGTDNGFGVETVDEPIPENGGPDTIVDDISEVGYPGSGDYGDGKADLALFDTNSGSLFALVSPGDRIEFDGQGERFIITDIISGLPQHSRTARGVDNNDVGLRLPHQLVFPFIVTFFHPEQHWNVGANGVWGRDSNDPNPSGLPDANDDGDGLVNEFDEQGAKFSDDFVSPSPHVKPRTFVRYRIFRQPRKIPIQPVELPGATVLDLAHSGFGPSGREFAAAGASDDHPIVITFAPNGSVEAVYMGVFDPIRGDLLYQPVTPTGDIHLLIGQAEQLLPPEEGFLTIDETPPPPASPPQVPVNGAVSNNENIWITIRRRNGDVTTAENAWRLAPAATPNMEQSLAAAREFARSGQAKGGN